jgi:DNA (cytosine-5)-methyltransferase 3A
MRVLSLFDGISGAQQALKNLGIIPEVYYASEIDKYAISVTMKNFPNTIQLGDVRNITKETVGEIDLLVGGSPCQGFSFAGKQLNFNDERSKLFFEYVRILNEIKPKYFLLENVKMKKEYEDVISESLGVKPIAINSALVSAQTRKKTLLD